MYAMLVPRGDQIGEDTVAPLGVSSIFVTPVRGLTIVRPVRVVVVTERARLARVSICRPPNQRWDLPNALISPRSVPVARKNHVRSGLGLVNEISTRGVMIIRSRFSGGFTNRSVRRTSCGFHAGAALLDCAEDTLATLNIDASDNALSRGAARRAARGEGNAVMPNSEMGRKQRAAGTLPTRLNKIRAGQRGRLV